MSDELLLVDLFVNDERCVWSCILANDEREMIGNSVDERCERCGKEIDGVPVRSGTRREKSAVIRLVNTCVCLKNNDDDEEEEEGEIT